MPCRFSPEALAHEATPVDNLFLIEYMPQADGLQLQVYLLGLMQCRYPGFEFSLADRLGVQEQNILSAFAYWQQEGLVRILCADPLDIEYLAPSARAAQPMLMPGRHQALVLAVQSLFAPRALRPAELRRLYDWVEVFQLDEGAVLELVSYCLHRKGAQINIRYLDTVAKAWADAGVRTAEQAREQAAARDALTGGAAGILKRWHMNRMPIEDELLLYDKWTKELGFTHDAVLAACPAMTNADRPSFAYLDGVLSRLHNEGVTSAEAINAHFSHQNESASFSQKVFMRMGMARGARPGERTELLSYLDHGMPEEVILYAADQSADKERPLTHIRKLLKEYHAQNITTLEQAQACIAPQDQPARKKRPDALDYPQQTYTAQDLKHIFIPLDGGD